MSDTLKSALTGAVSGTVTAILLYMFLPSRVEIEREVVGEKVEEYAVGRIAERIVERVAEVKLPPVLRIRQVPYDRVGFMRFLSEPFTFKPLSNTSIPTDGVGIYYPSTTFYDSSYIDQSGYPPVEVCNNIHQCGITLTPTSALVLNVSNLNLLYIRNRSDRYIVLEVVYYQG